jgi:EAL domain-containing protein (putative c-di-GMP-specific phosphodiesterase class I)
VQAHRWARDHAERVVVAVNVSARQLAEPDFAAKVKATVGEFGLTHRQIALEVTESVLIGDIDASIAIFDELRRFGIKIFLDDFGTGYSSLNYLRRLPLDRVKIDRSFVSGAGDDVLADPVIVQSIIALAHKLGLRVVAEGVESARHLAALTELNCDAVQGFHFSQAVPAADATRMLLASGGLISTESVA